jgi:lysophospholipase L1-like esterase
MGNTTNRRSFVKSVAALSALPLLPLSVQALPEPGSETGGSTILFQGDSITDGNRSRNNDWNHIMGHGYQYIISSKLWYSYPAKGLHFFNRGISGNKVTDLAARWQADTLDIKPDVLSILIGINDTDAFIGGNAAFTSSAYETGYRQLLQQTVRALPNIKLILCQPFVLPVGRIKDQWDLFADEVRQRGEIVKKLSAEFNTVFVPLQDAFNKALLKAPASYWIWDGIHPMPAGHQLIANEWLKYATASHVVPKAK